MYCFAFFVLLRFIYATRVFLLFFSWSIVDCFGCVRYVEKTTRVCLFLFCFGSVRLVFVYACGISMGECILSIFMAMNDNYQFVFDMIGSTFYENGARFSVYFNLIMIALNIIFLIDIGCENSTVLALTTTMTVYFLFFKFVTTPTAIINYFNKYTRLRCGLWSSHGLQHYTSRAPLNLKMNGAQDAFSNMCDICTGISTKIITSPTAVTAKTIKRNQIKENHDL